MDARGMADDRLVEGAQRGSMDLLTEWTGSADKVLVF
jgi:sulfur relay (sulfurtransferase) complex TusBCD TusD component (DsrE family)